MKNIDIGVAKILLGFTVTALSMLIYGVSIFFDELWFRNWPQISSIKYPESLYRIYSERPKKLK